MNALVVFSQSNKIKISLINPNNLSVSGKNDTLQVEFRNITISTISGIEALLNLPVGIFYVPGSVAGAGMSEKNISNLQKPIFNFPNLNITEAKRFTVALTANCDVLNFINNGGFLTNKVIANYTGGSDNTTGYAFTIKVPSIVINSITNQSFTGKLGEQFVRIIELKNYGDGSLGTLYFGQKNGTGLKVLSAIGGQTYFSQDTVLHQFDSSHFKSVGNRDTWFDKNESIFIYDTIEIGACGNLLSDFWASWGSIGKKCQIKTDKANVIIKSISPKLVIVPKSSFHSCFGQDSAFKMGLMITNKGTDYTRNLVIDIFQVVNSGFYASLFSRIDSASIKVKKGWAGNDSLLKPNNVSYNRSDGLWSCLGNNPVGAFTWTIGKLDPGDTLYLDWDVYLCCISACNTTRYAGGWNFAGSYSDQCYNGTVIPESYGGPNHSQYFSATSFTPSDIADNQTKKLIYTVSSANFWGFSSQSEITIDLILGKGLVHSLNTNDFNITAANNSVWKPSSLKMYGDTLRAIFTGRTINFSQSELIILLSGDCSAISKSSNADFKLIISYVANKNCKSNCEVLVFCNSGSIRVHCPVNCGGGMNFKNFTAERISFGQPDNDDDGIADTTGVLDQDKIKTYIAMYSDTILTTASGLVTQLGSTFFWDYGYAKSTVLYGNYLTIVDATIEIYRVKTLRFSCDSVNYTSSYSGNYGTFTFDFSRSAIASKGCTGSGGYRLASGDSVCLKVRYAVSKNTGGSSLECKFSNEYYLGVNTNPTGNQKLQCDTFNGNIVIAGYYFTNYGAGTYTVSGCNDIIINQNYYLSIGACCGNYAGGNMFRYEYRNWARIAEIRMSLPKGYTYTSGYSYYYRTAGTLGYKYEYLSSMTPSAIKNDSIYFDMASLYKDSSGTYLPSDDGFQGYFYARIKPSCKTLPNAVQTIGYDMIFNGTPLGLSSTENAPSGGSSDRIIFNKPALDLKAVTNKILATKDTIEWIVRITNQSANSNAALTWLNFNSNNGIIVHEVRNLTTGLPLVMNGGIYRAGSINANTFTNYLIKATYTTCAYDSLEVFAGWDCANYPDSVVQINCSQERIFVYLEPVPTLLQSTITGIDGKIDLCMYKSIEITITNSDEPKAYQLSLLTILPEGVIIVDSAMTYKIHRDSVFKKLSYPSFVNGNTWQFNLANTIAELNKGFSGIGDTLSNHITLRFLIETNCDFTSGSFIRALPKGTIKCGLPVKSAVSLSKPIEIKGIIEPYYTDVKLTADTILPCALKTLLTYRIIYLGPKLTDSTDQFRFYIPDGFMVDSASFVDYINGPINTPNVINYNGSVIVEWPLRKNIPIGDSSLFSFQLKPVLPFASCGNAGYLGQAAVKQDAICVKDSSTCTINVSTGTNYTEKPILKGLLSLNNLITQSTIQNNKSEQVDVFGSIQNSGENIIGNPFNLLLIADRNLNARFDAGDTLYQVLVFDSLLKNQSKNFQINAQILGIDMCKLILVTDSTACSCGQIWNPLLNITLKNAGNDTSICSAVTLLLGDSSINSYKYLWNSALNINSDTVARPLFSFLNNSSLDTLLQLIIKTDRGSCSAQDTINIKVFPQIFYNLNDSIFACENDSSLVGLKATNGSGSFNYKWQSHPELYDYGFGVARIFPSKNSTFYVSVIDGNACSLNDSIFALITPKPKPQFTINLPCQGTNLQLNDLSNYVLSGTTTAKWFLADTLIINNTVPIQYPSPYRIKLVAINNKGCLDSTSLVVNSLPNGQLGVSYSTLCTASDVLFTQNCILDKGTFKEYKWQILSDSYTGQAYNYRFNFGGKYTISLKTQTDSGCYNSIDTNVIVYAKPNAQFYTDKACYGDTLFIYATSPINTPQHKWILENKDLFTDSIIKYTNTKLDSISLYYEITSDQNCKDSIAIKFAVRPKPIIQFNGDTLCNYEIYNPKNTSNINYGKIVGYTWDLGDGTTLYTDSIKHQFALSGIYDVNLKAISDYNCIDSAFNKVEVNPVLSPALGWTGHCQKEDYIFNDLTIYASTSAKSINWLLDGAGFVGATFSDNNASKGFRNLNLSINTTEGCLYQLDTQVYVHPLPIVAFTIKNPCGDNFYTFKNTSSNDSISTLNYLWSFGDGNTSNIKDPSHGYTVFGNSSVKLEAINTFGCTDSALRILDVNPHIYADFTVDEVCEDEEFSPADLSSPGKTTINQYLWQFGDGEQSTNANPIKSYKTAGIYNIKLTLTNNYKCQYDTFKSIPVHPKPTTGFAIAGEPLDIFNSNITVTDQSSGAIDWVYYITDQTIKTTASFDHTFKDSGQYLIKQFLTSDKGCMDSLTKSVFVGFRYLPWIPNAFSPNNDGYNDNFSISGTGIIKAEMVIFNRWGEKLFQSEGDRQKWDGKYKGEVVENGVYYYSIKVVTYTSEILYYHGTLHVLR